jgi:hypothetical protein
MLGTQVNRCPKTAREQGFLNILRIVCISNQISAQLRDNRLISLLDRRLRRI